MYRPIRFLAVVSLVLVAGCAAAIAPVERVAEPVGPNGKLDIESALNHAISVKTGYAQASHALLKTNVAIDGSALALGSAGTAAAAYDASTDLLKGLGLGVAAVLAGEAFLKAEEKASVYLEGIRGLNCVIKSGRAIDGASGNLQDVRPTSRSLAFVGGKLDAQGNFTRSNPNLLAKARQLRLMLTYVKGMLAQAAVAQFDDLEGNQVDADQLRAVAAVPLLTAAFEANISHLGRAIETAVSASQAYVAANDIVRDSPDTIVAAVEEIQSAVAEKIKTIQASVDIAAIAATVVPPKIEATKEQADETEGKAQVNAALGNALALNASMQPHHFDLALQFLDASRMADANDSAAPQPFAALLNQYAGNMRLAMTDAVATGTNLNLMAQQVSGTVKKSLDEVLKQVCTSPS